MTERSGKRTANRKRRKNMPITVRLLIFIMLMLAGESILLGCAIFGGGILDYMRTNEKNVFHERVVNRKRYLEEAMLMRWSDVEDTAKKINAFTKELLDAGEITLDTLDDSSVNSMPLLEKASQELITMIRSNRVTGTFLILNTDDLEKLSEQKIYLDKPGLYLRDYDPASTSWERDKDLLWNYAPAELVRKQEISLDSQWKSMFDFKKMGKYMDYLYEPYQAALTKQERQWADLSDLGYWDTSQCVCSNERAVLTYSVPLILEGGTVYGVLGVDILADYVEKQMPSRELLENAEGTYLLGLEEKEGKQVKPVISTGNPYIQTEKEANLSWDGDRLYIEQDGEKLYCSMETIELYNKSSPFYGQTWVLAGICPENRLFQFSNHVVNMLGQMFLVTVLVGMGGGFLVSVHISRPVIALAKDVRKAKPTSTFSLKKTGIREIDELAGALERQSGRLNQVMEKFSYVINMAQIPLGVFEINRKDETVFITEKFFGIFGMEPVDSSELTVDRFWELLESLEDYRETDYKTDNDGILYRIPIRQGETHSDRYIRMMLNDNENSCIGFAEEVTEQILEKKKIEYERNHDPLTGLMNRRAFDEKMKSLFMPENKDNLKTAAFIMMDLDELKRVNDNYGHTYGDQYIQNAAKCFRSAASEQSVLCRLAGDEFCMFFYGYDKKEEIRVYLKKLMEEMENTTILLPNEGAFPVQLSGGVAWYPEDGITCEDLLQSADLAMYKVKKSGKGAFGEPGVRGESKFFLQNQPIERETILIVDDMEINRDILVEMLKDDYDLMEATDGQEAIETLEMYRSKINLLLLDIVMPRKDGFEVLQEMNTRGWIGQIPVIIISSENTPDFMKRVYQQGGSDYICRPFDTAVVRQRVQNTLMLYAKQKKLMQMVAEQVYEREKFNDMMISIFSNIVEFRNGESGLHVLHIRIITELLCRYLSEETRQIPLSQQEIAAITTASSLHDVGKIAISGEILNKPGKLTEEEFAIMKTHAAIGAAMVEQLEQYRDEALVKMAHDICRWHHERWDGRGYPDGLKGDEIPIAAQIVALADVYDALTSERVYKKAYTGDEAAAMILTGKCGAFNPILLDALEHLQDQIQEALQVCTVPNQERTAGAAREIMEEMENYVKS